MEFGLGLLISYHASSARSINLSKIHGVDGQIKALFTRDYTIATLKTLKQSATQLDLTLTLANGAPTSIMNALNKKYNNHAT